MTPRRSPLRGRVAALAFSVFYGLPQSVRVKLVRLATFKYVIGSVVLVRDAEAADPGRLLLLRQPSNKGWTLPAGLLRRRESPLHGAARELAEETGIVVEPQELRPAVPNALVHAKGWVDMVFELAVPASTTVTKVDGLEVHEAAWYPLDALPRLSRSTARLLAVYGIGAGA